MKSLKISDSVPSKIKSTSIIKLDDHTVPFYKIIKSDLTRSLRGDALRTGVALPTEKELALRYGVSVGTVRRALMELVAEKILVRQQGRGTFLAPFDISRMLNSFWHIVRRKDGHPEVPQVCTLHFKLTTADDEVAARLDIPAGSEVYSIRNLMLMAGRPVLVDNLQIPCHLFPGLTEAQFWAREATIYDLYRDRFGVNVVKTVDRLHAVAADLEVAKLLNRQAGSPVLEIVRVAHTFEDKPVEYRRSLLASEEYEFVDLTGGDANG